MEYGVTRDDAGKATKRRGLLRYIFVAFRPGA